MDVELRWKFETLNNSFIDHKIDLSYYIAQISYKKS